MLGGRVHPNPKFCPSPLPSTKLTIHEAPLRPDRRKVLTFRMPNRFAPIAWEESLPPSLAAHLYNLMMYLQLPEGGVKTAFSDEVSCQDRCIVSRWPNRVSCRHVSINP